MHAQSCLILYDPMDGNPIGSSALGFPRQEYWIGLPLPHPGDLPNPGIELVSLASPALASRLFTAELPGRPKLEFTLPK